MTVYRPGSIRRVAFYYGLTRSARSGREEIGPKAVPGSYIFVICGTDWGMVCIRPVAKIVKTCLRRAD